MKIRLVKWLLWSPRRLVVSVFAAMVVMFVGSAAAGSMASNTPSTATVQEAADQPAEGLLAYAPTAAPTPTTATHTTPLDAAAAFMVAFTQPDAPSTQWVEGLRDTADPALVFQMYGVDNSRLPATEPDLVLVSDDTDKALVECNFPNDPTLYLSVTLEGDSWVISAVTGPDQ